MHLGLHQNMQPVNFLSLVFMASLLLCTCRQGVNTQVPLPRIGGPFEDEELMFMDMPGIVDSKDTSPAWNGPGEPLHITGTIYQADGITPAANVLMYYYHTNHLGLYHTENPGATNASKHGDIRGWVRTDASGRYDLFTRRPAPYPNQYLPAHIHLSVKEPELPQPYFLDDLVFDDDPLLKTSIRKKLENRGGSGILRLVQKNNVWVAEHDIYLGLNIPHYPIALKRTSGPVPGEEVPSFIPFHVYGPDAGKRTCPLCKYGTFPGMLYFSSAREHTDSLSLWLQVLDNAMAQRAGYLKVFVVRAQGPGDHALSKEALEKLGKKLGLKHLALAWVPHFRDTSTELHLYGLEEQATNTLVVYRLRTATWTVTNALPSSVGELLKALDAVRPRFGIAPPPQH